MQKLRLAAAVACAISLVACGTTLGESPKPSTPSAAVPFRPTELVRDATGALYASDCPDGYVFKIGRSGAITVYAGTGVSSTSGGLSGDNGPAIQAALACPYGLAFDRNGRLVIADLSDHRIRAINSNGVITTIAGSGAREYSGDGGAGTQAGLNKPVSVVFDRNGNLYIGDHDNDVIRMVNAHGTITTIAGTGVRGYSGDGASATLAQLGQPEGMVFDPAGNLNFVDFANHRIRKIDTHGIITTIAGTGIAGYSGDGGPAIAAQMQPNDLGFDPAGNLYVAEFANHVVRMIDTKGMIRTIAGTGKAGCAGYGGRATGAQLMSPLGPVLDSTGNLYFADGGCHAVLRIDANGIISIFAGSGR